MSRTKTLTTIDGAKVCIENFPNFYKSGSVAGMRALSTRDVLYVRCGNYIYDVSESPEIYELAH